MFRTQSGDLWKGSVLDCKWFQIDYYDEKITPGEKVFNEEELFESINNFSNDIDLFKSKRKVSLDFFHNWSDGKSSERTYKEIKRLTEKK